MKDEDAAWLAYQVRMGARLDLEKLTFGGREAFRAIYQDGWLDARWTRGDSVLLERQSTRDSSPQPAVRTAQPTGCDDHDVCDGGPCKHPYDSSPQDRPVAEIIAEGKTYDHVARGYDCKYVAYDGKPMPGSGQSNECRIIHELTEALERLSKRVEELETISESYRKVCSHSAFYDFGRDGRCCLTCHLMLPPLFTGTKESQP